MRAWRNSLSQKLGMFGRDETLTFLPRLGLVRRKESPSASCLNQHLRPLPLLKLRLEVMAYHLFYVTVKVMRYFGYCEDACSIVYTENANKHLQSVFITCSMTSRADIRISADCAYSETHTRLGLSRKRQDGQCLCFCIESHPASIRRSACILETG